MENFELKKTEIKEMSWDDAWKRLHDLEEKLDEIYSHNKFYSLRQPIDAEMSLIYEQFPGIEEKYMNENQ